MATGYWQEILSKGLPVPEDRPLDDLSAELTTMLGSTDPEQRDGTAYPTLATWIDRGVYDDLLPGLGDGMAAGLTVGLGENGTDSVFRRSFSVLALAECLARDNVKMLLGRIYIDLSLGVMVARKSSSSGAPSELMAATGSSARGSITTVSPFSRST